jgi:hypothetical protein
LPTVERVSKLAPQLQVTFMSLYAGCISGFMSASISVISVFTGVCCCREKAGDDTRFTVLQQFNP